MNLHIRTPPLFLSSNNKVHESEIRPDKLSRTHRTFGNTLLGFLYNKFDGLDFVRYLPNFMPLSMRPLLPSPTTYPPLYFYIANEIPPYQIPTRRGRRMGKICSNYPRSAILASNPPIFSTPPLFFFKTNSMNRRAHVNSTILLTIITTFSTNTNNLICEAFFLQENPPHLIFVCG